MIDPGMEEFHDQVRDMDWHKAQTEAARNGQTAAMEFAEAKSREADQFKITAEFYSNKSHLLTRSLRTWRFAFLLLLSIGVPISFVLGGWILG